MASLQPDFQALITRIATALENQRIRFMLIGGQAVLLHGEPRLTQDIDITLAATPDALRQILVVCEMADLAPLPEDPDEFARTTFVLPAASLDSGIRVDFIFSSTPYEAQAIERAVRVRLGDADVPFAAAEDLILHKLFAARPRDLEDAEGVIRRKGGQLDWDYIESWAAKFASVPGRETMVDEVRRLRHS